METKQYVTKQPMDHWRNQGKKYLETNDKRKHNNPKPSGRSKTISKREVYSNIVLPQETRKISTNNLALYLKQLKRNKQNPKIAEGKKS